MNQISTGRYNYGKTPIFYAATRCRDDVVLHLLAQPGIRVKIINNKGQSLRSLALSHLTQETIEAIEAKEREEKTDWVNYRDTHSDGLKYGDLDARFYAVALEPGRGATTYETRRRNFKRLNKGVSWENPSGIDREGMRRTAMLERRRNEALDRWKELDNMLEQIIINRNQNESANSDALIDLVTKILRAETAIATSGQKPEVAMRASEAFNRVAHRDTHDFQLLRAAIGASLTDSGSSDRAQVRQEKARRTACKILASAIGMCMAQGAWSNVSASQLFDLCGSSSTYASLQISMQSEKAGELNDEQIIRSITNACESRNSRDLRDLVDLLGHEHSIFETPSVIESVMTFSDRLCRGVDGDDSSSIARTAVSLADLGSKIEVWKIPLLQGVHRARSDMLTSVVSKILRRLADTWENDMTALASEEIIMCMEWTLMNDLIVKGEWLEAKAYASTRDVLRQAFMEEAKTQDGINEVTNTLESASISNDLPILVPKRKITVVNDVSGLVHIRETLSSAYCHAVAFDCEWRDPRPLSTLQFCPAHVQETFIVDVTSPSISRRELSDFIVAVFCDPTVKKLGFAPEQDWRRLRAASKSTPTSSVSRLPADFEDANVIDLQGGVLVSLASVVADTLGFALDKRCQRSNWDMRPLSQQQLFYAALDAEVLLAIATQKGVVESTPQTSNASRHRDAHLYETDSILFRDRTPNFGAELGASDTALFSTDARNFGSDLWESDRVLFSTPERMAEEKKIAALNAVEKSTFVEQTGFRHECPICLSAMEVNEKLIQTKCGHTYHARCLMSAMKSSNSLQCPTCRAPIQ